MWVFFRVITSEEQFNFFSSVEKEAFCKRMVVFLRIKKLHLKNMKHLFCSRPCKGKTALNLVTTVEMQELLTSPVVREEKTVTNGAASQQALDSGTCTSVCDRM